jgi:hypothetical protein
MNRLLVPIVPILAAGFLASGSSPAISREWQSFPALTTIDLGAVGADGGASVAAHTAADSSGRLTRVAFDPRSGTWTRPAADSTAAAPAPVASRLDQVLVFQGGLFDQFAGRDAIDLGSGFSLAKRDSGYALLENGEERGWPAVTEDEVDRWGREVRLGLPREFPEDRLMQLFTTGRLQNVPGPVVVTDGALWFGLVGGFSGGDGQLGGIALYDRAQRTFRVFRHKFMVDASVTRLLVSGDDVWIGTGRYGPTRLEGMRGLVLYRPKKREWRQFAPDNSRISGDLIYDLAVAGSSIWATTNQGVSRYDATRRLWTSWYWHAAADGGFTLKETLPGDLAEELIR